MPLVELCVESAQAANSGFLSGVDRVELCRELWCGGLTPHPEQIGAAASIPLTHGVRVLVRENPSTFVLTGSEVDAICSQIEAIRTQTEVSQSPGVAPFGFVVGAVTAEGTLDPSVLRQFRESAADRPLTFHRAFDTVADQSSALEALIESGFDSILTTGGDPSRANPAVLRKLVHQAAGRIEIIGSGAIRSHNVRAVAEASQVPAIHMRAPGQDGRTDKGEVRAILAALRKN